MAFVATSRPLLLLLTLSACSGPSLNLTPGERSALSTLDLALEIEADHGEKIWPGFSLIEEPLLIHRPGKRSFLIAAPSSVVGDDVAPRDLKHLPRVIEIPAGEVQLNPSVLFSRDVPLRGVEAFMIRHTDGTRSPRWFRLLVHEVFHRHQQRHFVRNRTEPLCRYPVEDETLVARALLEQRRLGRALTAAMDEDAAAGLRRYVAYRLGRYEATQRGPEARTIEDWEERLEGTARLVEDLYAIAAGHKDADATRRRLQKKLDTLAPKDLQKWRYYHTGEALLLLLQRLSPGGSWRRSMDDGASPLTVARAAAEESGGPIKPTIPDPRALAAAREIIAAPLRQYLDQEQALLDEWTQQGDLHVTLIASTSDAVTYSSRGVTFHLPDCSRFISRITWFIDRAAGLDVRDRSLVLDGARGRDAYRLEFYGDLDGDESIQADDAMIAPDLSEPVRFSTSLHIRGDGWRLDYEGAGRLEIDTDGLQIHLGDVTAPSP